MELRELNGEEVYKHFDITVENVVNKVKDLI